jgi:very-short-patch-repair endonuclease
MTVKLHVIARRQGGHVTRAQALSVLSSKTVDRWVSTGRLIAVHPGVYALGHLPTNAIDRAHAALLAGGETSALAGESAFVLWGLWQRWPDPAEIISANPRRSVGIRARRSSTLAGHDISVVQGLRVTSTARTLLDMAPRLSEPQLIRAVNDLRLRRLLQIEALVDVALRNPRHQGARPLRGLLESAQPEPTRSVLEDAFLTLLKRHGLPTPQMNVHVAGYRVDALFAEHRLIVELDGWATHRSKHSFQRDRRQDADILQRTGIPTVRFTYDETTRRPREVAARLVALLRAVRN